MPNNDWDDQFEAAGYAYNVDPQLLKTVFHLESSGNPATHDSNQGAQGGMQMLPQTAAAMGITNPRDLNQAIPAAARYLAQGLQQTGTPEGALAYYHGGPNPTDHGPITENYVRKGQNLYSQMALTPATSAASTTDTSIPVPPIPPPGVPPVSAGATPVANAQSASDDTDLIAAYAKTLPTASGSSSTAAKVATDAPDDLVAAYQKAATAAQSGTTGADGVPTMTVRPPAAPPQGPTGIPAIDGPISEIPVVGAIAGGQVPLANNLAAGAKHGVQTVINTGNRLAAAVDSRIPALAQLDAHYGLTPEADVAAQPAAEAAYQAKYGNSLAAGIGNFAGQTAATAPILLLGGAGIGALGGAIAEGAGGAATGIGRGLQAGADLLTGSAAAPGAGLTGRALVRGAALGTSGALAGAGTAALSGDDIEQGAKAGAIAGPIMGTAASALGAVGSGAKAVGKGVVSGVNSLTGRAPTAALDAAAADADARAAAIAAARPPDPPSFKDMAAARNSAAPQQPSANPLTGAAQAQPAQNVPTMTIRSPLAGNAPPTATPTNPLTAGSGTPAAAPAPASVGASATTPVNLAANAMTPAQADASRAAGFAYKYAQQAKQGQDLEEYVKGSTPTVPEANGDAHAAAIQRNIAPGNQEFVNWDRANNEARLDHFDNLAGNATTLQNLEDARDAQAQSDLQAAWSNKTPADATPVLNQIQSTMNGPSGKLSPVRNAMQEVASALQKNDGSGLEDDPEMLYGARKQISFLMSKAGKAANPGYADATVQRSLQGVKDTLDQVIEPSAPGYQQYLANYSAASRPIDTQELLQSYRPNLMDAKGNIQLSRVNTMMKAIGQKLSAPGVNSAKSIDDDTLDKLFDLRSDLQRQDNRTLAAPAGSPTAHNQTVGNEIGLNALTGAAHIAASHLPGGNLVVGPMMANASAKANKKITDALTRQYLAPKPLNPRH